MCLGGCSLCAIPHYFRRTALREKYGLPEDGNDIPVTICCSPCAVCQEARFLKRTSTVQPQTEISNFVFSYL
jgi:Cys-rich protein (TIGR01571 family)